LKRGDYFVKAVELLKSLYFNSIDSRYSKIATAHPRTYEWAYTNSFMDWMKSDRSLFWISGKPGSGKSTLVKFLVGNPETIRCLEQWAGPRELLTASYFFWINGSDMQRSQEGLLRSVLFDILRQRPQFMDNVTSFVYRSIDTKTKSTHDVHDVFPHQWTFERLFEVFKLIIQDSESTDCFCFFIDGLDECDGELEPLTEFIKSLQVFQNIKLCIASRPWNVFEAAFGLDKKNKIYIQDLTSNDIRLYVKDKLEGHPDFHKMMEEELGVKELVQEVVEKAQGVFLWVYLVVKSLLEGLQNADRTLDLRRRLDAFPADLNDYFGYILDSLDPIYRVQTARGFRAALAAPRPLSVLQFWYLDHEEEDPEYAMKMTIPKPYEVPELRRKDWAHARNMAKRVTGRFKGLLEVTYEKSGRYYLVEDGETETIYELRVDFLHRTVKDFLSTRDCHSLITAWTPASFKVDESLCKAYIADLKDCCVRPECFINRGHVMDLVKDVFHSAAGHEAKYLLKELYTVVNSPTPSQTVNGPNDETLWCLLEAGSFVDYAIKHGATCIVDIMLSSRASPLTAEEKERYLRIVLNKEKDHALVRRLAWMEPRMQLRTSDVSSLLLESPPDREKKLTTLKILCRSGAISAYDFESFAGEGWLAPADADELLASMRLRTVSRSKEREGMTQFAERQDSDNSHKRSSRVIVNSEWDDRDLSREGSMVAMTARVRLSPDSSTRSSEPSICGKPGSQRLRKGGL
jgi:NACHT domain-containing protein